MQYRKVVAIVASEKLDDIEQGLQRIRVSGVSVSQVQGYGEYHNFYRADMMSSHARVEIFCRAVEADEIVRCLMTAAHSGLAGDGMIAVLPVEHIYCIRTQSELADSVSC